MNQAIQAIYTDIYQANPFLKFNGAVRSAYAYSNENLRKYVDMLNIKDGEVATVGSSLDQALYALLRGAKHVLVIDANPFTQPVGEMKKAMIENMSLKDFKKNWHTLTMFDENLYRDAKLSDYTREFLHFVNGMRARDGMGVYFKIIDPDSFDACSITGNGKVVYTSFAKGMEFYDNEASFDKLRDAIVDQEIEFKIGEFSDFSKILQGRRFSTIELSNVYNYYYKKEDFFRGLKDLIDNNLEDNGTIQPLYSMYVRSMFETAMKEYLPDYKECTRLEFLDSRFNDVENTINPKDLGTETDRQEVFIYEK